MAKGQTEPLKELKTALLAIILTGNDTTEDEYENDLLSEAENAWAQREWSIQHVLFPSLRLFFKPPNAMATNGTFVQVMSDDDMENVSKNMVKLST
nr:DNA mismatch repair protein MLH1 isoform X1 [Ipomoea batatas]